MADRPLPQIRGAFRPAAVRAPPSDDLNERGGVGLEVVHAGEPGCWTGPEPEVGRPLGGDQACGSQGVGGRAAGGTHGRQLELHPRRWAWCPEKHPRYPLCQPCLAAEGPGWRRCTAEIHSLSWNVAAGSPTWILLEFPQLHHPTTATITITFIPVSRKPVHSQSHHDFRANGHISPSPPVTLALCPLPGWGFLRPRCPGCWPRGPPSQLLLAWSCLSQRPRSQLCVHPGAGEEGQSREEGGIRQNPLPDLPSSGSLGKGRTASPLHQPPPWGRAKEEQDVRSLLPETSVLTLLPSCPALLFSTLLPQCGGLDPLRVPPLLPFFLLPMFTSNTSCPFHPSIRPGEFQLHHIRRGESDCFSRAKENNH